MTTDRAYHLLEHSDVLLHDERGFTLFCQGDGTHRPHCYISNTRSWCKKFLNLSDKIDLTPINEKIMM